MHPVILVKGRIKISNNTNMIAMMLQIEVVFTYSRALYAS